MELAEDRLINSILASPDVRRRFSEDARSVLSEYGLGECDLEGLDVEALVKSFDGAVARRRTARSRSGIAGPETLRA